MIGFIFEIIGKRLNKQIFEDFLNRNHNVDNEIDKHSIFTNQKKMASKVKTREFHQKLLQNKETWSKCFVYLYSYEGILELIKLILFWV